VYQARSGEPDRWWLESALLLLSKISKLILLQSLTGDSYDQFPNTLMEGSASSQESKTPGLFYVNSKITDPELTPQVFTRWYETVHIPDILATPSPTGIKGAVRYHAEHSDRPYLALYPLADVDFLESQEFHSIPVKSELLPKSGSSFDVASFDARPLVHIKTYRNRNAEPGTKGLNYLLTSIF
jgi:hypothetical protein